MIREGLLLFCFTYFNLYSSQFIIDLGLNSFIFKICSWSLIQDPRRLDPRRVATLAGVPSIPVADDAGPVQSEFDGSASVSRPPSLAVTATAENPLTRAMTSAKSDDKNLESPSVSRIDLPNPKEDRLVGSEEIVHSSETFTLSDHASSLHAVDEDSTAVEVSDVEMHGTGTSGLQEPDQSSPAVSNASASEETCQDLPPPPLYFELTEEQQSSVRKLAIEQIIESYKRLMETGCSETCKGLLAQLITQVRNMISHLFLDVEL